MNGSVNVFKTKSHYKILTQLETIDGFLVAGKPIYVLPLNANIEELKIAIFQALEKSRAVVRTPKRDEYPLLQKDLLRELQEKSYTSLYKESSSCDVLIKGNTIHIYPERYLNPQKPSEGLVRDEGQMLEIFDGAFKPEEVTYAILEKLSLKLR